MPIELELNEAVGLNPNINSNVLLLKQFVFLKILFNLKASKKKSILLNLVKDFEILKI